MRQKQLKQSLEKAKRSRTVGEETSGRADAEVQSGAEPQESDLSGLLSMSEDVVDTEDENADPSFEKFLIQLKEAVKIAEAKYPKENVGELCGFLTTVAA